MQLDNLSLHGQGPDQTFLELGPDVILDYRADADRDLLVQNLSLSVGRFSVGPNPAGFPGLSVQDLSTLALGSGSLTFSNVTWVESGVALPVIETHVAGWPYQGSIHFVDSQLDLPQTEVNLDPLGSLELVTTTIDASSLGSDIRFGRLTLDSANITADGPVFFNVESGMAISNSTLTSVSRSVELGHRNTADLFTGTETVISNSQFNGSEAMYWWFGPDTRLLIEGSELHSDEEIEIRIEDSGRAHINTTEFTSANSFIELHFQPASESLVVDNVLNSGEGIHLVAYPAALVTFDRNQVNSDYNFSVYSEAAVFTAEANTFRLAIDPAATDSDAAFTGNSITSGFTLHDNTFTWESAAGGARLFGNGSFTMSDNSLTGFENSGTALFMWRLTTQDEATVTATGNRFESFENALVFNLAGSFPGLFDARINGNVFDFPMTAAPQAARVSYSQDSNTSLDATNNVWHDFTTAAEVEALIAYDVSTAVLTVDPVTPFVAP